MKKADDAIKESAGIKPGPKPAAAKPASAGDKAKDPKATQPKDAAAPFSEQPVREK